MGHIENGMRQHDKYLHISTLSPLRNRETSRDEPSPALFLLETGRLYLRRLEGNTIIGGPSALSIPGGPGARVGIDGSSRGYRLQLRPALIRQIKLYSSLSEASVDQFSAVRIIPIRIEIWPKIEDDISTLQEELQSQRDDSTSLVLLKIMELLTIVEREVDRSALSTGSEKPLTIQELSALIRENYSDSFALDDLAARCALHPSYLSRVFKQHIGMSLFQYINNVRIQKACQLLKRTELPVIDVAFSVGYNNVSFFNRYFKKITGSSPSEYRKRSRA